MVARTDKPPRRLLNNTLWAMVGEATTLLSGSAAFFLLVDRLGPLQAGFYGVITALATVGVTASSMGVQALLMRNASAGVDFGESWSRAVSTIMSMGVGVTLLVSFAVQPWILPEVSRLTFGLIFLTQAVLRNIGDYISVTAAQAHRRMEVAAVVRVVVGLSQLAAVSAFALFGDATVQSWSYFTVTAMAVTAVASLFVVHRAFGATPWGGRPTAQSLRDGLPFALGSGSGQVLDSVDRPMLIRLGPTETDTGIYNVGYRLVAMSMTPLAALVRASFADFFDAGLEGRTAALNVAKRMTARAALFGAIAGVCLFVFAPAVPMVIGDEWSEVSSVLRYLAFLPLIKALQVFPANALTGSGNQSARNRVVVFGIVANVSANLALIPAYGWRGAALATLIAEALMAAALWRILTRPDSVVTSGNA